MRYGLVMFLTIIALALPGCATKQKKAFDKFTDKVADRMEEDCPDPENPGIVDSVIDLASGFANGVASLFGSDDDAEDTRMISASIHRASVAGCDFVQELVAEE